MAEKDTQSTIVNATNKPEQTKPKGPLAIVNSQIQAYLSKGTIHLPADYSADNAMKEAWLIIQKTLDRNQKPALSVCTETSVVNAMLDMVIQGLDPVKKQCYFIVYGDMLTCQRSYFGDLMLACRVRPWLKPYWEVIREGEKFVPKKTWSDDGLITVVETHELGWPRTEAPLTGAYVGAIDMRTGKDLGVELMDINQIRTSWKKSKTMGPTSFHNEQPDQAALRTVIRRWAKLIINSSTDEILLAAMRRQNDDAMEADVDQIVEMNANSVALELPESTGGQMPATTAATKPEAVAVPAVTVTPPAETDPVDETPDIFNGDDKF